MPIITDAEKIQLVLETLGIEGITAGELAYDRLEKQIQTLEKAEGTLLQQAKALTSTEYELTEATNQQSTAARELAASQYVANQAVEKSIKPVDAAGVSLDTMGRRAQDAEKAILALATGHGMMRLGPVLERLAGAIGGPAGIGFAVGSLAVALESMLPKFLAWINADNAKHAKEIADAAQKQADAADQLAQRPTKKEAERIADIQEFLTETPGLGQGGFRQRIEQAIRKDPNAMLTPDEIRQLQMQGGPGSEAMVRRRNEMIRRQQEERITAEVNRVSGFAPSDQAARLRAIELAETHPEFFGRTDLAGALRRAQAGEQIGPTAVKKQREEKVAADNLARKLAQDKDLKDAKEAQKARDEETDANNLAIKWGKEVDDKKAKEAAKAEQDRIKGNNDAARVTRQVEEKQAREAARAKAHEAREAARANTPEGRRRAERQAIEGQVEAVNQQYIAAGMGATPEGRKHQIAEEAIKQYDISGDIVTAVNNAIVLYNQHLAKQMARGLGGVAQQGAGMQEQMNGMQMFNAPGMWR